jgi:hypothetical protein
MKKAYETPQESISYSKNTQGDGFIVQGVTLKGVRHTPWTKQIIERKIAQLEKDQHGGIVFQYAQYTISVLRDILIEMEGGR